MYVLVLAVGEYSDQSIHPIAASESKQHLWDFAKKYEAKREYKHGICKEFSVLYGKLQKDQTFDDSLFPERPETPKELKTAKQQKAWIKVKYAWQAAYDLVEDALLEHRRKLRYQAQEQILSKYPEYRENLKHNPKSYEDFKDINFGTYTGYFYEGHYAVKSVRLITGSEQSPT